MKLTTLAASLLLVAPLTGAWAQSSNNNLMYEVTITNITRGSFFTPVLVASHRPGVELFTLGQAASEELAALAEGGDIMPLEQTLLSNSNVVGTGHSDGLLGPGHSVTVRVPAGNANQISLAAMILPTNDGFIALNGVAIPRSGSQTFIVNGYDAGSEPNDELCQSIPGPDCGGEGGSPGAGGEGFVHIHAGIHGIGDLQAAEYDWRNPMASVTVQKIR
ncbi:MAG TPA: spondin domain-containing protein [Candidatus Competibacteraceae bacterium]|nr:spondin domain-containing protein [Candidatus Competibacteraceae bacterium]MCP5134698.1 spondin domain-containing protein [Gammaproteobacteria bacterium]HPF57754.1 spondin domain-containing protein [Candidatus Competibacteraceae bacterium]HRY18018.1 spondin domain-containing protein [Candidatus Competibacteraceae bacterium]